MAYSRLSSPAWTHQIFTVAGPEVVNLTAFFSVVALPPKLIRWEEAYASSQVLLLLSTLDLEEYRMVK